MKRRSLLQSRIVLALVLVIFSMSLVLAEGVKEQEVVQQPSNSLTFLSYGAWRVHPGWDEMIKGFETKYGASVTIIYAPPAQIYNKLVTTLAAKSNELDVIVVDTMWMPSFVSAGFLSPLPDAQSRKTNS